MSSVFEIPLTPNQNQKISISLNGVQYKMMFKWLNVNEGGWAVDIDDAQGNPILHGVPLVTGGDLFGQFQYLGFGGAMLVQTDGDVDAPPSFENLGQESHLYYIMANA